VAVAADDAPGLHGFPRFDQQQGPDQVLGPGRGPGDVGRDLLAAGLPLLDQAAEHGQRDQQQQQQETHEGQFVSDAHRAIPTNAAQRGRGMRPRSAGGPGAKLWHFAGSRFDPVYLATLRFRTGCTPFARGPTLPGPAVPPRGRALRQRERAMSQYIYTMIGVSKTVPPKRQIIKDISLSFYPGAKIGLLGLNGAGKSTVLRIMAGVDTDFTGEARPQPGIKVGYLEQEPRLNPEHTVRQAVEEGVGDLLHAQELLDKVYAAYAEEDADFDKLAAEQQRLEAILATGDAATLELQLEIAADALRLPPWDAICGKLSGGEKRRVALCRLLLSKPDMLLLDEPTNHLDAESVEWLEQFLTRFPGTVVAVTHDRYFLDNAAEWILELDRGRGIPWKGNYSEWLMQKTERLKQEESQEKGRQKALQKELEWSRQNAKGGRSKGKARLQRLEELQAVEYQKRNETNEIFIPPGERLGDKVIEFKNVSKSFGDRLLIDDLNITIPPGAIVGIIGPNGAGKSTLFKMITGAEKPDKGEVNVGHTVKIAYVDQSRDALEADKNVWQAVSGGSDIITIGKVEIQSRAYIGRFNFKGADQQKLVGTLSGGERGRLHMAKTLLQGGNVLLLDEPSNDLDIETLRALEDALLEFPGCALVISHDRWFLDRIATHIIAFEGDSHVEFYQGNYREYEEDKKRRLGEEGAKPHRLRYKALK
jgi:sulfate-transporting ATPase